VPKSGNPADNARQAAKKRDRESAENTMDIAASNVVSPSGSVAQGDSGIMEIGTDDEVRIEKVSAPNGLVEEVISGFESASAHDDSFDQTSEETVSNPGSKHPRDSDCSDFTSKKKYIILSGEVYVKADGIDPVDVDADEVVRKGDIHTHHYTVLAPHEIEILDRVADKDPTSGEVKISILGGNRLGKIWMEFK